MVFGKENYDDARKGHQIDVNLWLNRNKSTRLGKIDQNGVMSFDINFLEFI